MSALKFMSATFIPRIQQGNERRFRFEVPVEQQRIVGAPHGESVQPGLAIVQSPRQHGTDTGPVPGRVEYGAVEVRLFG